MDRRAFLQALAAAPLVASGVPAASANVGSPYAKLLVLIELKGGNDGLNTVVPFADPAYSRLRPRLGIARAIRSCSSIRRAAAIRR